MLCFNLALIIVEIGLGLSKSLARRRISSTQIQRKYLSAFEKMHPDPTLNEVVQGFIKKDLDLS